MRFEYTFASKAPHGTKGVATLQAAIVSSNGWQRAIATAHVRFKGDQAALETTLDLRSLPSLIAQLAKTTHVDNTTYQLVLTPTVGVHTTIAGSPLQKTFTPTLSFAVDPFQLRPTLDGAAEAAGGALRPTSQGSVDVSQPVARRLSFAGHGLTVSQAREVAVVGLAAALLLGLAAAVLYLFVLPHADEADRIRTRYGAVLVPVAGSDGGIVEVDGIDQLIRLAERYERLVMHEKLPRGHAYWLADDGIIYLTIVGEDDESVPNEPIDDARPESAEPVYAGPERRMDPFRRLRRAS